MPIPLTCACGTRLQIGEEHAGQEGTCPACGRTLRIPRIDTPLATAAAPGSPVTAQAPEPERELTDHGGGALPAEADFFVPPPERIGPVLSAHTTMSRRDRPLPSALRIFLAVAGGLAGLIAGGMIDLFAGVRDGCWGAFWPIGLTALGIAVAAYFSGFSRTCTYVGREGVARFTCSGGRKLVGRAELMCFAEAAELRKALHSTSFHYEWRDEAGRVCFRILGDRAPPDELPSSAPYHFARAAERAWTLYLLGRVPRELERSGFVAFPLRKGRSVRVSRGTITFLLDGPPVEWAAWQVERVEVRSELVCVLQAGGKNTGFAFPLADLANAGLFFHLLRELVGVEVR